MINRLHFWINYSFKFNLKCWDAAAIGQNMYRISQLNPSQFTLSLPKALLHTSPYRSRDSRQIPAIWRREEWTPATHCFLSKHLMLFFHPTLTLLNSTLHHRLASCLYWKRETQRNKTRTIPLWMELSTPVAQTLWRHILIELVLPGEVRSSIFV